MIPRIKGKKDIILPIEKKIIGNRKEISFSLKHISWKITVIFENFLESSSIYWKKKKKVYSFRIRHKKLPLQFAFVVCWLKSRNLKMLIFYSVRKILSLCVKFRMYLNKKSRYILNGYVRIYKFSLVEFFIRFPNNLKSFDLDTEI